MVCARFSDHVFVDYGVTGASIAERRLPGADCYALGRPSGGFNSLSNVMLLFTDRWLVLAGWVHYLAFDLFIGSWQVRDARRNGVPFWLVAPCLVLTFMFGPIGLLLYLFLAGVISRGKAWPGHPVVA
jgi:hypothetical protein